MQIRHPQKEGEENPMSLQLNLKQKRNNENVNIRPIELKTVRFSTFNQKESNKKKQCHKKDGYSRWNL